ncbi:MrcB family domain-containing protein [Lacinutrix venerupis]|uniref:AAA+ ATPase domain-containing protein n=1 Tax=Lacinutrix venerupis TaxID=1486034 RepID=A0AAC9PXS8_9FLAO|nr:DUF3578 domain-containing protein [Lacinutrix venerupis]APY01376.1 hypothetical protein BWR22_14055 [Lacinutrix venerupis]
MLFDKVTLENLKSAIKDYNTKGTPEGFSTSKYYDVKINGKLYPPKPIMAIANFYATGKAISNYFSGGENTPCFKAYERLGVEIVNKTENMDKSENFELVHEFLKQAKTNNLKTKHFQKTYRGTKIKVSFGQGNSAKIPWISFLKEPFTTSDGIYPVYLYYKNINILILAYGKSETNTPSKEWSINNPVTIYQYFKENGFEKPDRYGDSYVFKKYDVNQLPSKKKLNEDLDKIIEKYSQVVVSKTKQVKNISAMKFNINSFQQSCKISGLNYKTELITRYIASLATKPFAILSGLSGSGKTKLAQAFAQWIAEDENQFCIVPVGADWTNREPLLGYVNALDNEEYILPENGALKLLIEANKEKNKTKPYFLILDEMNLSHVERYFADFLSIMESKDLLKLHSDTEAKGIVTSHLNWPKNLFIIGTVNIDETTYMFSPKVLDRANVIEFRVNTDDISKFLDTPTEIDFTNLNGKGAGMGENFIQIASNKDFNTVDTKELNTKLILFFEELKKTGAEFGYRTATEIHRLYNQLTTLDTDMLENDKIDITIMQKLLPKLHGSRRKLCPILETLASFCVVKDTDVLKAFLNNKENIDYKTNTSVLYPLSLEKITRMYKGAVDNGFASYAEA